MGEIVRMKVSETKKEEVKKLKAEIDKRDKEIDIWFMHCMVWERR